MTESHKAPEHQHEEEHKEKEHKSSLLSDILSIIGFAILFIILIWGIIRLVSLAGSSLSSFFSRPLASIQVSAPAQATSGQSVTVSWKYSPSVAGGYAFLYQCKDNVSFQMQLSGATSTAKIPCGVAYTLGGATSSIALVPKLSGASSTADNLSIVFIPSAAGTQVQGSATMTITPAAASAPAPVKAAAKPSAGNTYTSTHYSGPADLSVRIISASIDQSGAGVVSFDIGNVGGTTSGPYYFSAQLPTAQYYPYQSPEQSPLAPGSHIVDTLRFTAVAPGGGTFSVSVQGGDSNTSNNYASTVLSAPYNSYNGGYNYYGNSGTYIQYPTYNY